MKCCRVQPVGVARRTRCAIRGSRVYHQPLAPVRMRAGSALATIVPLRRGQFCRPRRRTAEPSFRHFHATARGRAFGATFVENADHVSMSG